MNTLIFLLPILSDLIIVGARFAELGTNRNTIRGQIRENLTFRLFLLAGMVVLLASIAEYVMANRGISWPFFALGWAVAISSFALRRRAIAALGRFWSLHVEIRDEHEFVQDGPFKRVRHPAYLSMIMELLALAMICNARWAFLAVAACFVPVLIMRIRTEEEALIGKFGDAYREYRRTTPALFPKLW